MGSVSFGVKCQIGAIDYGLPSHNYPTIKSIAGEADRLGFDSVLLTDHLSYEYGPWPECWLVLAALASYTKRAKLGPFATCCLCRAPSMTAKMAATLDYISEGRLRFTIGAGGWGQDIDHQAYGIPFSKPSERILRLKESVEIIRKMWREDAPSFQGKYYSIKEAKCDPKPIQRQIPIWIGGSGSKLLQVAAEVADGWDTGFCTLQGYQQILQSFTEACDSVNRRVESVHRSYNCESIIIARTKNEVDKKKKEWLPKFLSVKAKHTSEWVRDLSDEEYLARKAPFIGTPEEIIEQIGAFIDLGVRYFILRFPDAEAIDSLALFSEEVLGKF
jgi:alkanesulfonate monooxygenase SsuD/methylene tetrahydromethanopterin reductase-like flavin-dependent oxidoreductase (luciferase family)